MTGAEIPGSERACGVLAVNLRVYRNRFAISQAKAGKATGRRQGIGLGRH